MTKFALRGEADTRRRFGYGGQGPGYGPQAYDPDNYRDRSPHLTPLLPAGERPFFSL